MNFHTLYINGNRNECSTENIKIYNCNLTMSSTVAMVSAVEDDRGRRLPVVRSIELVVCNFLRNLSNACLFNVR